MRILFLLSFCITINFGSFSQQISVEVNNLDFINSNNYLNNAIIGHNDEIVISCPKGIFFVEDSIIVDTILLRPNADYFRYVFKGAFDNYIYSENGEDVISWSPNGIVNYNTAFIPGAGITNRFNQLKQTANGSIIAQTSRFTDYILLFDTVNFRYFSNAPFHIPSEVRPQGISHLGNDKYIISLGSDLDNKVLILDIPNDTLLIRNSTDYTIGSTPYEFFPINNDSMVVISRTDINYIKNDSVVGFTDFSDNGFLDEFVFSAISPITGKLIMANWENIAIFDGSLTVYNDTNGFNTPYTILDFLSQGINSKGEFYLFHRAGDIYKISEPRLLPMKNNTDQKQLNVFPNPFSTKFSIQSNSNLIVNEDVQIEIFNLDGKAIDESKYAITRNKNVFQIAFSKTIPNGIFILTFQNSTSTQRMKLVKSGD